MSSGSYSFGNANVAVSSTTTATVATYTWLSASLQEVHDAYEAARAAFEEATLGPACHVCEQRGAGQVELPDRRSVHRWPCRERLR